MNKIPTLIACVLLCGCNHTAPKLDKIPVADHKPTSAAITDAKTEAQKTVTAIGEAAKTPDAGQQTKAKLVVADGHAAATVAKLTDATAKSTSFEAALGSQKAAYEKNIKNSTAENVKLRKEIDAMKNSIVTWTARILGIAGLLCWILTVALVVGRFYPPLAAFLSFIPNSLNITIALGVAASCLTWLAWKLPMILQWTGRAILAAAVTTAIYFAVAFYLHRNKRKRVVIPPAPR